MWRSLLKVAIAQAVEFLQRADRKLSDSSERVTDDSGDDLQSFEEAGSAISPEAAEMISFVQVREPAAPTERPALSGSIEDRVQKARARLL